MEEITLQALLEAGCHFGHKAERWHPKASEFIYTKKDGIHIIDLGKTKAGLDRACAFVKDLVAGGGEVLFVATKRQAMGVVKEEAVRVGVPHLVQRWIGGFLTNWDEIKKNIVKIINLETDHATGKWKGMPKHEQSKLLRYIERLKILYGGVLSIKEKPNAIFVVDVRREYAAVREAIRMEVPIIGIVDTNSDPAGINYVIPANDDAVGSIQFITRAIASSYLEGKEMRVKETPPAPPAPSEVTAPLPSPELSSQPAVVASKEAVPAKPTTETPKKTPASVPPSGTTTGKRGRPKKTA